MKVGAGDKTETKQVVIKGYKTGECPVSMITGTSTWLLELIDISATAGEAGGAAVLGSNSAKWPAWWMDALAVVERVKNQWKVAEIEAQYGRS